MPADPPGFDSLYREAVQLADRARGWFDGPGQRWRAGLSPDDQAWVATESLAITARLIAVMAWLLDPANGVRGTRFGAAADTPMRPFTLMPEAQLPDGSPLDGQPGGEIARASRHLVARLYFLAQPTASALTATPATQQPTTGFWQQ